MYLWSGRDYVLQNVNLLYPLLQYVELVVETHLRITISLYYLDLSSELKYYKNKPLFEPGKNRNQGVVVFPG